MARLREQEWRGWATTLLAWREAPLWLEAEVAACRYFIAPGRHEVLAWGEVRDWGGRYRVELGSFADVSAGLAGAPRCRFRSIRTCCGMAVVTPWRTRAMILGRYRLGSATR